MMPMDAVLKVMDAAVFVRLCFLYIVTHALQQMVAERGFLCYTV